MPDSEKDDFETFFGEETEDVFFGLEDPKWESGFPKNRIGMTKGIRVPKRMIARIPRQPVPICDLQKQTMHKMKVVKYNGA